MKERPVSTLCLFDNRPPRHYIRLMKKLGFLSFGHWTPSPHSQVRTASDALTGRLEAGGILIAPVGPHNGVQTLVRVVRTDTGLERKALVDVRFVPALPGIAREL